MQQFQPQTSNITRLPAAKPTSIHSSNTRAVADALIQFRRLVMAMLPRILTTIFHITRLHLQTNGRQFHARLIARYARTSLCRKLQGFAQPCLYLETTHPCISLI
jgi:hypothetical protein